MIKIKYLLQNPDMLINKKTGEGFKHNASNAIPFISFNNGQRVQFGEGGESHPDLMAEYRIPREQLSTVLQGRIFLGNKTNYISVWNDSITRILSSTREIVNIANAYDISGVYLYQIYDKRDARIPSIFVPIQELPTSVEHYRSPGQYIKYLKQSKSSTANKDKYNILMAKYNDMKSHPQLYFNLKQKKDKLFSYKVENIKYLFGFVYW